MPPPDPSVAVVFQGISELYELSPLRNNDVPPTPRTFGDADGYSTPPFGGLTPESPAEATKVIPWPFCDVKVESRPVSPTNSELPKLIDTTDTPGCCRAELTAPNKSAPLSDRASTSRIWAPGAIACAHSTSSEISAPQFVSGGAVGGGPPGWRTLNHWELGP